MRVFFGNLTVKELINKCKLKSITKEEIEMLEEYRCDSAKVEKNKFHIFDKPNIIICNGKALDLVIKTLSKCEDEFEVSYNIEEKES